MIDHLSHLTDADFDKSIKSSSVPVLVDFWAPWCGPCQMLAPILDEVATGLGVKVKVYKLNVDENPEISGRFRIMSIPTIMIFKDGEIKETFVGVQSKEVYEEALNKYISE